VFGNPSASLTFVASVGIHGNHLNTAIQLMKSLYDRPSTARWVEMTYSSDAQMLACPKPVLCRPLPGDTTKKETKPKGSKDSDVFPRGLIRIEPVHAFERICPHQHPIDSLSIPIEPVSISIPNTTLPSISDTTCRVTLTAPTVYPSIFDNWRGTQKIKSKP
jgi:hypothetical protein